MRHRIGDDEIGTREKIDNWGKKETRLIKGMRCMVLM